MGKDLWARPWVRQLAVVAAYGVASFFFRAFSVSGWEILAGLRLGALLLVPYRYWPALVVGESAYYIYLAVECAETWGMTWGLCTAPPPIIYVIPIVYWVREKWSPIGKSSIFMGRFLGCALIVSAVLMVRSVVLFSLIKHLPKGYLVDYPLFYGDYFIGSYLGILTVTPLALFIYHVAEGVPWRQLCRRLANNRLLFESACMVIPLMSFLFWVGVTSSSHTQARQIMQIATFLPVVWLALRHGWGGAAIGGSVASCAVFALTPTIHDYDTLRAEVIVSFAISTMLLMGERIAVLDRSANRERTDFRQALALAQRNVYVGEMQLRVTSQALDQIRETIQVGFTLILGRLRHLQPAVDDRSYQRHVSLAQDQLFRLADGLYPIALRERGLPNALRDGTLARVLDEAGLKYSCELRGGVSDLSHTLRMTIYRIIWEVVTEGCLKRDVRQVRVRVRGVEKGPRRAVVVVVYFRTSDVEGNDVQWDQLLPNLVRSSSGLGLQAVQDRAAIFEGYTKTRSHSFGRLVTVYMLDPSASGGG
jgi:two-component system, NarL family, sensor histidine kinase FusK